jgi:hypothetical protein
MEMKQSAFSYQRSAVSGQGWSLLEEDLGDEA